MESAVVSIIGGLLIRLLLPDPIVFIGFAEPDFVRNIPPGHYVGISREHAELAEAKEDALTDAIRQIFMQIGTEYSVSFEKNIRSVNGDTNKKVVNRFNAFASGILPDVEVKKIYLKSRNHKQMVYALIYFPPAKIKKARKVIKKENALRLNQFESLIQSGVEAEKRIHVRKALHYYRSAGAQAETLFAGRKTKKILAENHIRLLLSRLMLKKSDAPINAKYLSCKVLFKGCPVADIPVRFKLMHGRGTITSTALTDSDGIVRCDYNLTEGFSNNRVLAWIDITGADVQEHFVFSTVIIKPDIRPSLLIVKENCFSFELIEASNIDAEFDRYEVHIDARYRYADFMNYFIIHTDRNKNASRSFNLSRPIRISGKTTQPVTIPFNRWVTETVGSFKKWYLGSQIDYRIVLKGTEVDIIVH